MPAANLESFSFARARLLIRRDLLMTPPRFLLTPLFFCIPYLYLVYFLANVPFDSFNLLIIFSCIWFHAFFTSLVEVSFFSGRAFTRIRTPVTRLEIFAVDFFYFIVVVPVFLFVGIFFLSLVFTSLQQIYHSLLMVFVISYFPLNGYFVWRWRAAVKLSRSFDSFSGWSKIFAYFFFVLAVFIVVIFWEDVMSETKMMIYSAVALMIALLFWVAAYRRYARC